METIGERLSKVVDLEAVSLRNFCDKFDFNYNSMQPILNDRKNLGVNILKKFIETFPYLTSDWILFGKGELEYVKKDENTSLNIVSEPSDFGYDDAFEKTLIAYMQRPNVRKALKKIVNE